MVYYLVVHTGPDQVAGFSILAASEPRQRFVKPSSGTCCLPTMQQWQPTPSRSCRPWSTISLRPRTISDYPSVWRRQTSWDRIQWNCQPSPSMTMSSMLLNSSHISAPPSLTTSPWTLRSIGGLGRQPQHLLASLHECGPTPNWQWRPRC